MGPTWCSRCRCYLTAPMVGYYGPRTYTVVQHGRTVRYICYICQASSDRDRMIRRGQIRLQLQYISEGWGWKIRLNPESYIIRNDSGLVIFRPHRIKIGNHLLRYDVWFDGPDRYEWHGSAIGNISSTLYCKRISKEVKRESHLSRYNQNGTWSSDSQS